MQAERAQRRVQMKEEKLHQSPGTRCGVKVDGKSDGIDEVEVGGGELMSEASSEGI